MKKNILKKNCDLFFIFVFAKKNDVVFAWVCFYYFVLTLILSPNFEMICLQKNKSKVKKMNCVFIYSFLPKKIKWACCLYELCNLICVSSLPVRIVQVNEDKPSSLGSPFFITLLLINTMYAVVHERKQWIQIISCSFGFTLSLSSVWIVQVNLYQLIVACMNCAS